MARPRKCRKVNSMPHTEGFLPIGYDNKDCPFTVRLTLDEYEVIRLIDLEGFTQEECADKMEVSRPTVTNVYTEARYKLADALINEKKLIIEGGDIVMNRHNRKIAEYKKESKIMKIAVTFQNGEIFQHFGHCEEFKIYDVEEGKVTRAAVVPTLGSGHGALAGFLKEHGVSVLICGGIGGGAQNALAEAGIKLYGGVNGNADAAVESLLKNSLEYDANVHCDHHGEGHDEGHQCGQHSEGHQCGHGTCGH